MLTEWQSQIQVWGNVRMQVVIVMSPMGDQRLHNWRPAGERGSRVQAGPLGLRVRHRVSNYVNLQKMQYFGVKFLYNTINNKILRIWCCLAIWFFWLTFLEICFLGHQNYNFNNFIFSWCNWQQHQLFTLGKC